MGGSFDLAALPRHIPDLQPDVVLLDLEGHEGEHVATLSALGTGGDRATGGPGAPAIVVLTDNAQGAWLSEVLRSGVQAILPRQASAEEIVAAVKSVATGLVVLHPEAAESVLRAGAAVAALPSGPPVGHGQALTAREAEVLGMLAEGLGNKEIAWRLGISEHTVKFHINSIFNKLDASSRTEAVTIGIRRGLVMI
jgi:DNA-binding NarL/FixJ family response regulator